MIFQRGDRSFILSEPVDIQSCQFAIWSDNPKTTPGAYLRLVSQIRMSEMFERDRSLLGTPHLFAIDPKLPLPLLHVWPTPDREIHAKLRYNPALKEI